VGSVRIAFSSFSIDSCQFLTGNLHSSYPKLWAQVKQCVVPLQQTTVFTPQQVLFWSWQLCVWDTSHFVACLCRGQLAGIFTAFRKLSEMAFLNQVKLFDKTVKK
jgi:hypothetical protein